MRDAFMLYDEKYAVSQRRHLPPSFNEIRHILNLAQVMALSSSLKLISFDGDQTLYSDGGNFDNKEGLAEGIAMLMKSGVNVAVITAAGYGLDGSKYEVRLRVLLDFFGKIGMTEEEVGRFFVFGGECNYLMRCSYEQYDDEHKRTKLVPIEPEVWQAEELAGPKPAKWPEEEITQMLDIAEGVMKEAIEQMQLRAKVLRKERAIGVFPGGDAMAAVFPKGHGSKKLKQEALDEIVLRILEGLRVAKPRVTLPYCVFNGGRDAWLDIGNKRVGVAALQAFLHLAPAESLHVGDQFLNTGNDLAARETCPCIWITSPRETSKILEHVLRFMSIEPMPQEDRPPLTQRDSLAADSGKFDVYSGARL
jgi:IMP and pyridine-specific 5'-nucleotidase